jgi:hypothetical protein
MSHFKPVPTKITQKLLIFLLQSNFEGIWIIHLKLYTKKLVTKIIELTARIWYQNLQLLFPCQLQIIPPSYILTPKISGPFWWILGLNYVLIDMWGNDQNEMMFFYFQLWDLVPYYANSLLKKSQSKRLHKMQDYNN